MSQQTGDDTPAVVPVSSAAATCPNCSLCDAHRPPAAAVRRSPDSRPAVEQELTKDLSDASFLAVVEERLIPRKDVYTVTQLEPLDDQFNARIDAIGARIEAEARRLLPAGCQPMEVLIVSEECRDLHDIYGTLPLRSS